MRIIQIIDSLQVGGAEKMAVNFANALSERASFSGLVVTRKEGDLKSQINQEVKYVFINKKKSVDFKAIFKLRAFCRTNMVEYAHAHGTSFFTAFLLKLTHPSIKVIFHEHAGGRIHGTLKNNLAIWFCSKFFAGVIVVNQDLKKWFEEVLKYKNVIYLPNFTLSNSNEARETLLKGKEGKRILCLANLRLPKNHNLLIDVAAKIKAYDPEWTFHLVGKDFQDAYSKQIVEKIKAHNLEDTVYIYGLKEDTGHIISQCTIGVLTSVSEGLPVALLEYGLHKKAVVSTNVGEIPLIISDGINGYSVPSNNIDLFAAALIRLIDDRELIASFGNTLYKVIAANHAEDAVMEQYFNWLKKV